MTADTEDHKDFPKQTTDHSRMLLLEYGSSLLLFLVIVGYPLLAAIQDGLFSGAESRAFSVPFRLIIIILSFSLWVGAFLKNRIEISVTGFLFIAFWCMYLIRVVHDISNPSFIGERPQEDYILYSLGLCIIPSVGFAVKPSRRSLHLGLVAIAAVAPFVCLITLELASLRTFLVSDERLALEMMDSIGVGHLGADVFLLGVFLFSRRVGKPMLGRIGPSLLCLSGLALTVITGSRGPLLSLLTVGALFSILNARKRAAALVLLALGILAVTIIGLTLASDGFSGLGEATQSLPLVQKSMRESQDIEGYTRLVFAKQAWNGFTESPLLGSSLVLPDGGEYPHNLVLESFMCTGIFGGLAFLALIIFGVKRSIVSIINKEDGVWISLLYLEALIGSLFSGSIWGNGTFWCLLAAVNAWVCPPAKHAVLRIVLISRRQFGLDGAASRIIGAPSA